MLLNKEDINKMLKLSIAHLSIARWTKVHRSIFS